MNEWMKQSLTRLIAFWGGLTWVPMRPVGLRALGNVFFGADIPRARFSILYAKAKRLKICQEGPKTPTRTRLGPNMGQEWAQNKPKWFSKPSKIEAWSRKADFLKYNALPLINAYMFVQESCMFVYLRVIKAIKLWVWCSLGTGLLWRGHLKPSWAPLEPS